MAPVILECSRRPRDIRSIVCVTGQHREMLVPVIEYFGIRPDIDLDLMTPGQAISAFVARCLQALDPVIEQRRPDCVVAQGDTATVAAAALASFYRRIAFVHVEAGLRTRNLQSPWPEEFNRRLATLGATLHCAPTTRAAANLAAEGVPPHAIHVTGNTVVDAVLMTRRAARCSLALGQPWPVPLSRSATAPPWPNDRRAIAGTRRKSSAPGIPPTPDAVAGTNAARRASRGGARRGLKTPPRPPASRLAMTWRRTIE